MPLLLTISDGAWGWFVTTKVTDTDRDPVDVDGAEIVIPPVYVLAVRPVVVTVTVNCVLLVLSVPLGAAI